MKEIPENASAYNKTRHYTDQSVPGMMKNDHSVRAGVWGKIVVERGEVLYMIDGDDETYTLSKDNPGVIEPMVKHRIDPQPSSKFYIEFYR